MTLAPVFTGYAQGDRGKELDRFMAEFWNQLGGYQGVADHGERKDWVFFDRDGLKAGDKWNPQIIEALRQPA